MKKTGDKVNFYTVHGGKVRQRVGTLISYDDNVCTVVPDGKTKAILLPRNQVGI